MRTSTLIVAICAFDATAFLRVDATVGISKINTIYHSAFVERSVALSIPQMSNATANVHELENYMCRNR